MLFRSSKVKRGVDVSRYALDVLVGSKAERSAFMMKGQTLDSYFAKPNNVNFWDQYGNLLSEFKTAKETANTARQVELTKQMAIMAPEFGPAVVKSFITADMPVTNALSAKAYFKNAAFTDEIMKGQIGRKRVLLPTLNAQRKARINFFTTANKVLDIDKFGPKLVDDMFFGAAATDDGIAKTIIEGKEQIVQNLKANANAKTAGYFSSAMIQYRQIGRAHV